MLETPVILQEISRLQSSIQHLQSSQTELEASLKDEEDKDIREAFEENKVVILSQSERIDMLKLALQSRGMVSASHYDIQPAASPVAPQTRNPAPEESEENGVFL